MSEHKIKLAAALPKGEGLNGFDDDELAADLWQAKIDGRFNAPRVVIVVYGVKEAKADKEGNRVVTVEPMRVQPVKTTEGLRAVEAALLDEYVAEHGDILPFDVKHVTKQAFADLPRSTDEIDEAEERERETMSPADELRRHLENVHGTERAHLLSDDEAAKQHAGEHESGTLGAFDHAPDWHGWSRADIEAATADSDGDPHAGEGDAEQLPLAVDDDPEATRRENDETGEMFTDPADDNVRPLFSGTGN